MARNPDDWYPFHATLKIIASLEQAGITPAQCWVGSISLADGRHLDRGHVVAIWGRDIPAFNRAVRKPDRIEVMASSGMPPKISLAELKADVQRPA